VIALYILTAFQIADIISTYIAISKGAHEANPVMAFVMNIFGEVPGMLIVKSALIAAIWLVPIPVAALYVFCLIYAVVIWNNINVIKEQK
jgi:Domain of unknown function (DUF5658)